MTLSLFQEPQGYQPLAARMRPHELAAYAGQEHVLSPGKPLYEARASSEGNSPAQGAVLSAMFEAACTSVLVSLRVRRFTARRRCSWRTRLSACGVRAPFQVRAFLATNSPQQVCE